MATERLLAYDWSGAAAGLTSHKWLAAAPATFCCTLYVPFEHMSCAVRRVPREEPRRVQVAQGYSADRDYNLPLKPHIRLYDEYYKHIM